MLAKRVNSILETRWAEEVQMGHSQGCSYTHCADISAKSEISSYTVDQREQTPIHYHRESLERYTNFALNGYGVGS
jgi:hypothetical protein